MSPNFKKINQDFEKYTKNVFIKGAILSVFLVIIAFIILFIRLLFFKIEIQNEHIQKNSEIINKQIEYTSSYILMIKDSFESFKNFDHKYKFDYKNYKIDALNRYIYNSSEIGTFISLYQPITSYLTEFSALQHVSVVIKNFQKLDYILWTYYYSKNKFVFVHPFIYNPITYKFSEESYHGDILQNTVAINEAYITPIYDDAITQKKIFSLTIPVFNETSYQGTFAVDIDLEKLFHGVRNLNKNNKNISLFLVDRNNHYYSFDKEKNDYTWFDFHKQQNIKYGFVFEKMLFFNTQKLEEGTLLVSSFSIINILIESLFSANLIYFIIVILIFYLFISINYFRYMKPQQNILIGVLEYLNSEKDFKEINEKKLNHITKEVYSAFKFLIRQFTIKIKIDNDIRLSKETIEYFIKSNYFNHSCGYIINPAFNFSGDYVKIFNLNENEKIFFIADVSGKGVGAMILVNQIDFFFNIYSEKIKDRFSFETELKNFNKYFVEKNINCDFIAFKAIYIEQMKSNEIIYIINAGFPELYVANKENKIQKMESPNSFTPLGIAEDEDYKFSELSLEYLHKFNKIIACTDGILEQTNKNGILYEDRFIKTLESSLQFENIEEMIKFIWNDFYSFIESYENQYDDFTVLVVKLGE